MKHKKKIIAAIGIAVLSVLIIFVCIKFSSDNEDTNVTAKEEITSSVSLSESDSNTASASDSKKETSSSNKEEKKEEESNKDNNNDATTETKKDTTTNTKNNNDTKTNDNKKTETTTKKEEPKKDNNLLIVNDVNGTSLLNCYVKFNGSKSLEDIMKETLKNNNVSCRIVNGYISMMFNLRERDEGALSGWVFYINNEKSTAGVASVYPKENDKITWKFVKDGVNN